MSLDQRDTVSSVGIIPRSHPYTSVNYAVKTFRHALALDERRARFRPNTWNEPTLEREQELDVDELPPDSSVPRDEREYVPLDRNIVDVEEVWFAGESDTFTANREMLSPCCTGCHADIGGGSHNNGKSSSLSYIPLRWMIKECLLSRTGILFDHKRLTSLGFDLGGLTQELKKHGLEPSDHGLPLIPESRNHPIAPQTHTEDYTSPTSHRKLDIMRERLHSGYFPLLPRVILAFMNPDDPDASAEIYDQLELVKPWWLLENFPMLTTSQTLDGSWVRQRLCVFLHLIHTCCL